MAEYSPTNNSIQHVEFTDITQTIAINDQELHQWRIDEVTGYSTSNGVTFDDLVITVLGSKSFQYSSKFEYAVNRVVHYNILADDQSSLSEYNVFNVYYLPDVYDNLHTSEPPDQSMTVTFHIVGQQRTGSTSTDEQTGQTTTHWTNWTDWSDDYTITITTNNTKHAQLIREACANQRFVKNSVYKPQW